MAVTFGAGWTKCRCYGIIKEYDIETALQCKDNNKSTIVALLLKRIILLCQLNISIKLVQ